MFEELIADAVTKAPPRVAAGFGDHVAYGSTYIGLVVDILRCGTFVTALIDPYTGRAHESPFYGTHTLHVVEPR